RDRKGRSEIGRGSPAAARGREAVRSEHQLRRSNPFDLLSKRRAFQIRNVREETMLTRRSILLASVATGLAMNIKDALAKAAQPSTPVNFDVPDHACDCHTHIHGDPEKFPFFAGRVYTPEPASPEEMAALHKALHIERVVIVTPSVYGPDNSATLFGMKAR